MNTLYEPKFEHDACGIGALVNINGEQTHTIVDNALSIVEKLEHRAGKDASGKTGDGVGILLQISHSFFSEKAREGEISLNGTACTDLGEERDYGIGMFFFPTEYESEKKRFEDCCASQSLEILGWRAVPVKPEVIGEKARECMPSIHQCFIARPADLAKGLDFDRRLYILRRLFENSSHHATYVCSLSSRTIVYKGMFLVGELRLFYSDLESAEYKSALALVHSRFSTNTQPSWQRAHPNRFIAHNGEINTIRGNVDRMLAREETVFSPVISKSDMQKILPAVDATGSDSAMLDNTLEFLVMNGLPLPLAVMMCIPEPWKHDEEMKQSKKDFYHY